VCCGCPAPKQEPKCYVYTALGGLQPGTWACWMQPHTWPHQTVQFTMNSFTVYSSPCYSETLISFSYS